MCGDPGRTCPAGSARPIDVPLGFYSIGSRRFSLLSPPSSSLLPLPPLTGCVSGGNESTRSAVALAPPGSYAVHGLLYSCAAGFYGSVAGLSSPSCSGPCAVPGYYCPAGSTSPWMRICGGDDFFCPPGTVAPIRVHSGFYTADYEDYYVLASADGVTANTLGLTPCPPGRWRNYSASLSFFLTTNSMPPCQLCPLGTFKAAAGDGFSQCRSCDARFSQSSAERVLCECHSSLLPDAAADRQGRVPFFNISSGRCAVLTQVEIEAMNHFVWAALDNQLPAVGVGVFNGVSAVSRWREMACEPGHYCLQGLRRKCPAGHYGSLEQETRPDCEGLCAAGFYCPAGSSSPFSLPCGGPNYICPEGSAAPTKVSSGFYSNEDDNTGVFRSRQLVW